MGIRFFVDDAATTRKHFEVVDRETGDSERHWVDLRTELSDKEYTALEASMVESVQADTQAIRINAVGASLKAFTSWIVGWSLTSNKGFACKPREEELGKLNRDTARILRDIVREHYQAILDEKRLLTREEMDEEERKGNASANPTASSSDLGETSEASSTTGTHFESGTPSASPDA
jgi:hypothetical protein